jgi:hypothetical protein
MARRLENEPDFASWHVAGQGPGTTLFHVCPQCRGRLLGRVTTGEKWENADTALVVWYPGSHWDPKWWRS